MPRFDLVVESKTPRSERCQQLSGMFDVPPAVKLRHEWRVNCPIEDQDWKVGLIVGPSGAGKSQIARRMFGQAVDRPVRWGKGAVIDDFAERLSMEDITQACMAVGFNTIPSWLKPHAVLSNGEKFRVELARRLLEHGDLCVVDEFSSVVDRQVARIASHAVQKFVRKQKRQKFVAVTCHYDVVEWLRPDWIYDPSTRKFARGCLQQRPAIDCTVGPVPYAAWDLFAPFHYMSASLHRAARCWGLWVGDTLCSFAGMLPRVMNERGQARHSGGLMGCSRLVTLPDFQGLGLAFVLIDAVAAIYTAVGKTVHTYPAHPALIHGFDRSPKWALRKVPGSFSGRAGRTSTVSRGGCSAEGGRPCAVFRYAGEPGDVASAHNLLRYWA